MSESNCIFLLAIDLHIWYRHSGQPNVGTFWFNSECRSTNVREVIADVGSNKITHLITYAEHVQSLSVIAANLTHLRLKSVTSTTGLQWYLCLCSYVRSLRIMYKVSL